MVAAAKAELVTAYIDALRERGVEPQLNEGLTDESQTVFFIAGLGYVLVAVSLEIPGAWQLDRNRIEAVNEHARNEEATVYYALLIKRRDGRGANGYLLTDLVSSPFKRPLEMAAREVLIQEKRHLDSLRLILSTDKQVDLLLRKRS